MVHGIRSGKLLPPGKTKIPPVDTVVSIPPRTLPVFVVVSHGVGYCMPSLGQVIIGREGLGTQLPTPVQVLASLLNSISPSLCETRAIHNEIVPLF